MSLSPGTRIGVYQIAAQIGVGGMGEVYRATDSNLKRSVAIKVLPASVAGDADRLARFQREAEVLAALNHPNIAAIYGLERLRPSRADSSTGSESSRAASRDEDEEIRGEGSASVRAGGGAPAPVQSDFTALVMELVEGDDLSQRIARGAIPIDEALPIARQIADAVEAAHEQGIIHRDLKPSNIKIRPDGTVKVLDFGLAKAMDPGASGPGVDFSQSPTLTTPAMTQAGMILGTAAYMAPEQARGKAVDRRADIWAFGAVLFEMLTGKRAFPGEDVTDIWIYDPQRDALTRLTFGGTNGSPVWSPDAQYIVFTTIGEGIFQARADGASQPQALIRSTAIPIPRSFTPDGKQLAYFERNQLWTVALEDQGGQLKAGTPVPFLKSTFQDQAPEFSPDGRWLAYHSNESGHNEVYVRAFPPPAAAGEWQVSNGGGVVPLWSRSGHELVYRSADQLMTVSYTVNGTTFVADKPRVWISSLSSAVEWDLAPDGKRVVALVPERTAQAPPPEHEIVMLQNFADELRRRVPLGK